MPEALQNRMPAGKWAVCHLGARMHYAVPRLLHEHEMLEHFHTDICSRPSLQRLAEWLPPSWKPTALKRLLDRVPDSIPNALISTYPTLGFRYFLKQRLARTAEEHSAVHLWMGRSFGDRVASHGFGEATAVYTFNTAALEILRAARKQGLFCVVEQTIAPRAWEEDLLAEEEKRHPGWSAIPPTRGPFTQETIQRENAEWQLADLIICGSAFVKEGIARCGGPVERCAVVPYGVDDRFSPVDRPVHGGPLRVLTVGEASLRKGIAYATEVAARLKGAAEFRWVGPASLTDAAARQVAPHVNLVGVVSRSEVPSHYQWADVFFLPSLCEGSATVIYEALQTGLPVVTTPHAGSVVRDGEDGFVVPICDVAAMEDRLRRLAESRELLASMSSEAVKSRAMVSIAAYKGRLFETLHEARSASLRSFQHESPHSIPVPPRSIPATPRSSAAVSAIVTAWGRSEITISTIRRLSDCRPAPSEILVHVDDNQVALAEQLREEFPELTVLFSAERLGPGGSRNRLLHAAREELVASFDDDSYPADVDFFQRVIQAADRCPDAAVFAAVLLDGSEEAPAKHMTRVAAFVGAGCVYRRSVFLQTAGYVPLPLAYGMEEVDLSLRLHSIGHRIMHAPTLRVVHEVASLKSVRRIVIRGFWPHLKRAQDPGHRDTREISAGTVANLALLPFLRYPVVLWPYGMAQCLHKVLEFMINGRTREALAGLWSIPVHLWRHRSQRAPLTVSQVWSYLSLRRSEHAERKAEREEVGARI